MKKRMLAMILAAILAVPAIPVYASDEDLPADQSEAWEDEILPEALADLPEIEDAEVTDEAPEAAETTEEVPADAVVTEEIPEADIVTESVPAVGKQANPFSDVRENHYFYQPVIWALQYEITNGTSATLFSPGKNCTRAQIVTFLWRTAGSPEPSAKSHPFTDVKKSSYYAKAVLWAVEKQITAGVSATAFEPDQPCTRGQAMTFLWRYAGMPEGNGSNPFKDIPDKKYYTAPVKWAFGYGVTSGTSADRFSPDAVCTRGQIVTFLYRFIQKISAPVERRSPIVLYASDTTIKASGADEVEIDVRIREEACGAKAVCTVLDEEGRTLASFPADKTNPVVRIGDDDYVSFGVKLQIPSEAGSVLTVHAEMNDLASETLRLYREQEVGDKAIETLCNVLDAAAAFVEAYEMPTVDGNDRAAIDQAILAKAQSVCAFLKDRSDVKMAWTEDSGIIRFVTADGLNGSVTLRVVFENEDLNYAGSGVTTGTEALMEKFVFDENFRMAPIDPDVLVICPIRANYSDRKGNTSESTGKALAKAYGGTCTLITDTKNAASPFTSVRDGVMSQGYGTVMLITHCGSLNRDEDTNFIVPTLYAVSNEATAQAAWNQFTSHASLADRNCLVWDGVNYHGARLIYNISEDHLFSINHAPVTKRHYEIYASSEYLMDVYASKTFPNTIFYLGMCHGIEDLRFDQFLVDHGASAVVSFEGNVNVLGEQNFCKDLFEEMRKKNTDEKKADFIRNYNVTESITSADTALKDPQYYGEEQFVYEAKGYVSGKVTDKKNVAISGIDLHAFRYWNGTLEKERDVTTGDDGTWKMENFPWGMYLLQAENGETEDLENVSFGEEKKEHINFTVSPGIVRCKVVDSETGEGINDVLVTLSEAGFTSLLRTSRTGYLDADGLDTGTYQIEFEKDDYKTEKRTVTLTGSSWKIDLGTVELQKKGSWLDAYIEHLRGAYSATRFTLAYIDDNDIPELIEAGAGRHNAAANIYTWDEEKEEIISLGGFGDYGQTHYAERTGMIWGSHSINGGYMTNWLSELKDGKVTQIRNLWLDMSTTTAAYKVDDKPATKAQYDAAYNSIEKGYSWIQFAYYRGFDTKAATLSKLKEDYTGFFLKAE